MKGISNKAIQSLALVALMSVCSPLAAKPTIAENFNKWIEQVKEVFATGQEKAAPAFETATEKDGVAFKTVKDTVSDAFTTGAVQEKISPEPAAKLETTSALAKAKESALDTLTSAKDALVDSKLGQFIAKHSTATKVTAAITATAAIGFAAYKSGLAKKAKKHKRKVIAATATLSALALGLLAYNKADALKDFASSIADKINSSKETPATTDS